MMYFVLFLIGAILIPVGDVVHVLTSTTFYPLEQLRYSLFGVIPFWVPFLFGFGGVGAGIHTALVRSKFPRKRTVHFKQVLITAISFVGMYFLSGLLPKSFVTDLVLLVCSIALYGFAGDFTWGGVMQTLGIMLGGTAFEAMLIHQGVFQYNELHHELFGVAPWLPDLYLAVAVSIDCFVGWWSEKKK